MISLVIYGVIAVSLAAAAGYAFLSFTNTSIQTTHTQENQVRMENAEAALRASLLALAPGGSSGVVFAPMGQTVTDNNGKSYTGLPGILGSLGTSPWGQPYLYCPVSLNNSTGLTSNTLNTVGSDTVTSPDGSTYSVTTYSGAATGKTPYVIATTPAAPIANIANSSYQTSFVAFIVSSVGPGFSVPDCAAIKIDTTTGNVSVKGGSVRGVTAGFPYSQRVIAATDRAEFYVSTNVSGGDSSGRDANNPTTLDFALNMWQSLQPRQTDIYLMTTGATTTYATVNDLDSMDSGVGRPFSNGEDTQLVIGTMPGSGTKATLQLNSATTATMLNSATTFKNLNITTAYPLTALKPLTLDGVTYTYSGSATSTVFKVFGSTLTLNDSSFSNTNIGVVNSTMEMFNRQTATTTFTNSPINAHASRLSFDALSSSGYGISNTTSNYPIALSNSSMNIAGQVTVAISSPVAGIYTIGSTLSVQPPAVANATGLSISGGSTAGGITAVGGSTITIASGATASFASGNGSTMEYGIWLTGSELYLEGTVNTGSLGGGALSGAIGMQQGELIGPSTTAKIIDPSPTLYPCLRMVQGIGAGASGTNIPVYMTGYTPTDPTWNASYASFNQAKFGMPPMFSYANTPTTTYQAAVDSSIIAANTNLPVVTIPSTAATGTASTGTVDPATLERAIRNIVNADFQTGTSINFYGACSVN